MELNINPQVLFEDVLSTKGRVKILKALAKNSELNISRIVENTGVNYKIAKKHLDFLVSIEFVQEKCFGRIKIYRYRVENQNAKALLNLINLWENC